MSNSTGVRSRADHSPRTAPAVDKAAHSVPTRPVLTVAGDSDPDMDEALRRVTTDLAYLQREQQLAAEVEADLHAAGVAA